MSASSGLHLGPLSITWGANQSTSKSNLNVSTATAAGLIGTGMILGAAGMYVAPKVVPQINAAVLSGTDKTVTVIKGLWGKNESASQQTSQEPAPQPVQAASAKRWYFLYLA